MVVQVKENQQRLLKACQMISNSYSPIDKSRKRDVGHSRGENRYAYVFSNKELIKRYLSKGWQDKVQQIIKVVRNVQYFNPKGKAYKKTTDESYYVSTTELTARQTLKITRDHWKIENKLNYVKDETMGEDKSRIRVNPENMVILRDLALNLIRVNESKKMYVKRAMYENSLNVERAMRYSILI